MVFYIPDQPQTLHMKPLKELGSQVAEFLTCAVEAFRIDPFSPDACHQLGLQLPRGWVLVCLSRLQSFSGIWRVRIMVCYNIFTITY